MDRPDPVAAIHMIEGRHEMGQIYLVFLRKALLSQTVIGIRILPMVPGA